MQRLGEWLAGISLMTTMTAAYYPPPLEDNQPQPCLCVNDEVEFSVLFVVRQPEMFTQEEAHVHRGKAWSATNKPVTCYVNPARSQCRPWYTMVYKRYTAGKLAHYRCRTMILYAHCLLSYHHTPTPVCVFMLKFKFIGAGRFSPIYVLIIMYHFALVAGVRYSAMFT
ncbi:hypothetical protein Cgig2_015770 [Carnegiea gigantea]|uniref:Secreted protein n=1 Tax=Carnegiea gigantea TaxID=171969 RepID=A0A9Q1QIC5_9CARY|nr:hypothetical protein Cgig2_015770 [Carnegiea gigantea]